jgi:uncharacterized membrane protein (DUF106 family)
MIYFIAFVAIVIILLTISGKKSSNENLYTLIEIINGLESPNHTIMISSILGLDATASTDEIIESLKKQWRTMNSKQQELTTIEIHIARAHKENNKEHLGYLLMKKNEVKFK